MSAADSDLTQEDLEEQLEAFMRRQAEIESGAAARKVEPGKVLGADEVSDEVRRQGRTRFVRQPSCAMGRQGKQFAALAAQAACGGELHVSGGPSRWRTPAR